MPLATQIYCDHALSRDVAQVSRQQMAFYDSWQACLPARTVVASANNDAQFGRLTVVMILRQSCKPAALRQCSELHERLQALQVDMQCSNIIQ